MVHSNHMSDPDAIQARLRALETLLDDTSPAVRAAVLAELKTIGEPAIEFLRALAKGENRQIGTFAIDYLRELNVTEPVAEFIAFIRSQRYDLETGMLLMARTAYPELDMVALCRELDRIAARCRELVSPRMAPRDQCRILNRVLFHENRIGGDLDTYADPRNSFINQVLARKRGIPISLSVLYLLIAERIGLPLEPVGLPGHFIVGCYAEDPPFFIDPFYQGAFRTPDDIFQMLRQNNVVPRASDLAPASIREVLIRSCRNLVNHAGAAGDTKQAKLFASFIEEFEAVARSGAHNART